MSLVVVRTHLWDAAVHGTVARMCGQLGGHRVLVLYDVTVQGEAGARAAIEAVSPGTGVCRWTAALRLCPGHRDRPLCILINEADCAAISPLHFAGSRPGSLEVGCKYRVEAHVIAAARALAPLTCGYLWMIEYDVHCHGNIAVPLAACDAVEADFMAQAAGMSVATHPGWCWWGDRVGREVASLSADRLRGCFFPATRYSPAMLRALEANLGRNSGYCEVYFPTLCLMSGLRMAAMPDAVLGAFRFDDPMPASAFVGAATDDLLYHPVKG